MKPNPIASEDHVAGPSDAKVTLLEYGDFECPFCVRAFPVIERVRFEHPECRFVFRHVARSSRGFEKQAAEASEFAATKGRFWEMHRELFSHPGEHGTEQLVSYAGAIGLDENECRVALVERTFARHVHQLAADAARSGIISTPALFIDGSRFEDRIEIETLGEAIAARSRSG